MKAKPMLITVLAAFIVLAIPVLASAEMPTPRGGGVTVAITHYPIAFKWGQNVTYGYKVTNTTKANKQVAIDFAFGDQALPVHGRTFPRRMITIAPGASKNLTLSTAIPPDPGNDTGQQWCLTIWVNGNTGAFSCGWTPGMK